MVYFSIIMVVYFSIIIYSEEVEVKTIEALRAEFLEHHGEFYEIV